MKAEAKQQTPKGWCMSGESPDLFRVSLDKTNPHSGTTCARLTNTPGLETCSWATLMQQMGPHEYLNKRLRMNLWVRTENVKNGAQPWMRVDGSAEERSLSFDNMCKRSIKGTTDWKEYSIVLDVPEDSTNIAFGIMLSGKGTLWMDDVSFEVVGNDVPITDCPCSQNFRGIKPASNLNFEDGAEE